MRYYSRDHAHAVLNQGNLDKSFSGDLLTVQFDLQVFIQSLGTLSLPGKDPKFMYIQL